MCITTKNWTRKKLCVKNFLLCLVSRDDSVFISCLTSLLYFFFLLPPHLPTVHFLLIFHVNPPGYLSASHEDAPTSFLVTRVNFVYKNKVNIYKNNKFNFFISFTLLIVSARFEILSCMITATAAPLRVTYVKFTSTFVSFKKE